MVKSFFVGSLLVGYVGVLLVVGMAPILADDAFAIDSPNIQVNIGSFTNKSFSQTAATCEAGGNCPIDWIGEYISAVYSYGIGITGVLAAVMITAGGFLWLTSAGSPERVGRAKEFITSALSGLAIALFSFIILYSVNPALTKFRVIGLSVPQIDSSATARSVDLNLGPAPSCGTNQPVVDLAASSWSCVSGVSGANPDQLLSQGLMPQSEFGQLQNGLGTLPLDSGIVTDVVQEIGLWESARIWGTLSSETQQGFVNGNVTPELIERAYTEIDHGRRGGVNGILNQITLTTQERMYYSLEQHGSEVSSTVLRLLGR